jgi:NAD(P)-dependent dehydrogenase (short-subunit alcohol dehydrogenase family)
LTLTKCLAQELSPGIIVNCIVPGHIATEEVISRYKLSNKKTFSQEIQKIPMGRLGRTNDVCNLVDYIINKSTFSTGHKFFVDGGMFMH